MHGITFSYGLAYALAIALLYAAFSDIRTRRIANWLNAAIALSAPLFWWATHLSLTDVAWQVGIAGVVFAALAIMFAMRWMGGGDVKLLTALALFLPKDCLPELLIIMALVGGLLTIVLGCWHIARRQRDRLAIPYGVAISTAGLWVLATHPLIAGSGPILG